MGGNAFDDLADAGVVIDPAGVAKEVHSQSDASVAQPLTGEAQQAIERRLTVFACILLGVLGVFGPLTGREADEIVLDFVKAPAGYLGRNGRVIDPGLGSKRVRPGNAPAVTPGLTSAAVPDG